MVSELQLIEVKSIYFLKDLFMTNSEIVSRPWLWPYLKYSAPKITASRHMQQNEYYLKINLFFYLKAEKAANLSMVFRSVEFKL